MLGPVKDGRPIWAARTPPGRLLPGRVADRVRLALFVEVEDELKFGQLVNESRNDPVVRSPDELVALKLARVEPHPFNEHIHRLPLTVEDAMLGVLAHGPTP
jgi:hypothetical protein